MRPSFEIEEALAQMGQNIKIARVRRRLTQKLVAERAGVSLNTLLKIEKGDPGVSIGNIASVLQALGFKNPFASLLDLQEDLPGILNDIRYLPQRVRRSKLS